MKVLFLHGWTSVPGSRKPTFLKQHGVNSSSRGGTVADNMDSGRHTDGLAVPGVEELGQRYNTRSV